MFVLGISETNFWTFDWPMYAVFCVISKDE